MTECCCQLLRIHPANVVANNSREIATAKLKRRRFTPLFYQRSHPSDGGTTVNAVPGDWVVTLSSVAKT